MLSISFPFQFEDKHYTVFILEQQFPAVAQLSAATFWFLAAKTRQQVGPW